MLMIMNEEQYKAGLVELEKLMDLDPSRDSPKGKVLLFLAKALEKYESKHYVVE